MHSLKTDKSYRAFLKTLFALALPMMLQNLLVTGLNLLDGIMVGRLGEVEIAAVSLANQPFFIITLIFFGFGSGGSVLITQYWGKDDTSTIRRIISMVILLCAGTAAVFTCVTMSFPREVMSLFSEDVEVIDLGARYLRVVSLSYLPTGISSVCMVSLRSVEQLKFPLLINVSGIAINTFFNFCLIFGKLGFPQMGVEGAALATVIARIIEAGAYLVFIFRLCPTVRLRLKDFTSFNKLLFTDFIKYSLPVLFNEAGWGIGISLHSVAMGRLGTSPASAFAIVSALQNLAFVTIFGIGTAVGILIGKSAGRGQAGEIYAVIPRIYKTVAVSGLVGFSVIMLLRTAFVSIYKIEADTASLALSLAVVVAVVFIFKCFNYTLIVGVLRSSGDSKFSMFIDLVFMWTVSIPSGYIAAFVLGWPIWSVFLLLMSDEFIKIIFILLRIKRRRFVKNVTRGFEEIGESST